MKVTLSLEKSQSKDVSIMVDTLRASTTITTALSKFKKIIPSFTPENAVKLAKENNGVLAGERNGSKIEGFDIGNSPEGVLNYPTESDTLILTTSNGTRILKNMNSKVLIGSFINGKAVAKSALNISKNHIDLVMAGYKGTFAIEDYLGCGEILYQLYKLNNKLKISEFAETAILASRQTKGINESILKGHSAKRLNKLGSGHDVQFCLQKNISNNVGIYENGTIHLLN